MALNHACLPNSTTWAFFIWRKPYVLHNREIFLLCPPKAGGERDYQPIIEHLQKTYILNGRILSTIKNRALPGIAGEQNHLPDIPE
jgi:hypothetical protein